MTSLGTNLLLIRDDLGQGMIDQPLGLAGRQHEIVFGDSSEVSAVDREPSISAVRDRDR